MKLILVFSQKLFLFIFFACTTAEAQAIRASFITSSANSKHDPVMATYKYNTSLTVPLPLLRIKRGGFNLSRINKDDLNKWKAIEKIALQKNKDDQPILPTLHRLWQWATNSEHTIVVELIRSSGFQSNSAGSLSIENFDANCRSHTVSLKLFLSNIDNALITSTTARDNGFIAFQSLNKEERYAEVLGHELSHAKYILNNNLRTRMVTELVETTNEIILFSSHDKPGIHSPFLLKLISQRDTLLKELEAEAEANEEIIWKELVKNKKK
jgi:hypothetical protein